MSNDIIALNSALSELDALKEEVNVSEKLQEHYRDAIFCLDYSSSMNGLLTDGKSAKEHLELAIKNLNIPAESCVSFSSDVQKGIGNIYMGGTNLEKAFEFILRNYKDYKMVVLISDGEPNDMFENNGQKSINAGRDLKVPINIIFIGNKGSSGEQFMERLAKQTAGSSVTISGTRNLLKEKIIHLLSEKN